MPASIRARVDRGYRVASYRVALWNAKREGGEHEIDAQSYQRLIAHYAPDGEALARLIGCAPPWLASWHGGSARDDPGLGSVAEDAG